MPDQATVVIPCLDSAQTLMETLQGLSALPERAALRVIVVDNGSTDDSAKVARAHADEVVHENGRGVASARNRGLALVQTDLVLSLDADCRPRQAWATSHLAAMRAAAPDVIGIAGRSVPRGSGDHWSQRPEITPAPYFSRGAPLYAVAGNACYRTAALRGLGGFPPFAADDAALGQVARAQGWRFVWEPLAIVEHANPSGWRGYARQMRKHGFYAAQLTAPRHRSGTWWLDRARHAGSALRPLAAGDLHDAIARATGAVAQTAGALKAWRDPAHHRPGEPAPAP